MTNLLIAPESLSIEPGSSADYQMLAAHHYRSGRPRTMTTVWSMVHEMPTVVGRYLGRERERIVAGVLVLSYPPLACQLRDVATGGRYVGFSMGERAAILNQEVRIISRVVVDPRYRGLGLAVRLVRHALHHAETVYTEALAAMGAVNPFFERAGMVRYERPPHPGDARLLDSLHEMGWPPCDLASPRLIRERLDREPATRRAWFERELKRWARSAYRARNRTKHQSIPDVDESLRLARDHLISTPIYYLAQTQPETST